MLSEYVFGGVASVVNRHPKAILTIMVILAIGAMGCMTMIPPQSLSDEYMDKQSPSGIVYNLYNNLYGQDSYILLIKGTSPENPALLRDLLILEKQIGRIDRVGSIISIADIVAENNGGVIPDSSEQIRRIINSLPADTKTQFVPDPQTALAYIFIKQGISSDTSLKIEPYVVDTIDQATLPPGVAIEVSGNTPYNLQIEQAILVEFSVLILACMTFMLVVKYFLYSKIRYWMLPVLLLIFGLFYTFGMMGLLGIPANDGALAAFPILLGLGIDYAVQFHSRFDDERRTKDMSSALMETLTKTGPAVFIALCATSLGFFVMFISPIPMIQIFATVSILGIVCCFLTSLFGFGVFAHLLKYEPKPPGKGISDRIVSAYDIGLTWIATHVVKIAGLIILVSVIFASIGIILDKQIPVDASEESFAPANLPAQVVSNEVQAVAGLLTPLPLYISGLDASSINGIWWIDRLCTNIGHKYSQVSGINSISTLVRSYNNGQLPLNQVELDAIMKNIPPDERSLYQQDHITSVVMINTINLGINEQRAFSHNIENEILWLEPPPGVGVTPTGDFTLYTVMTDQIVEYKDRITILGFVLIFLFLLVIYRKIIALTPLVPIMCVIGWNSLAMIALGQSYNMLTAMMGSMTIGVGSEYTILVMERYLEELQKYGDRLVAIREAVRKIGSAVIVSGLVTAAGFSALMVSSFPILAGFGFGTVIVVIFSLIGAIIIMPAILTLVGGYDKISLKRS